MEELKIELTLDYLAKKHYSMDFKDLCGPRQKIVENMLQLQKEKHEKELNAKEA